MVWLNPKGSAGTQESQNVFQRKGLSSWGLATLPALQTDSGSLNQPNSCSLFGFTISTMQYFNPFPAIKVRQCLKHHPNEANPHYWRIPRALLALLPPLSVLCRASGCLFHEHLFVPTSYTLQLSGFTPCFSPWRNSMEWKVSHHVFYHSSFKDVPACRSGTCCSSVYPPGSATTRILSKQLLFPPSSFSKRNQHKHHNSSQQQTLNNSSKNLRQLQGV